MLKRFSCILLAAVLLLCALPAVASAASDEATAAADRLYELGLFNGTGIDANGEPIFELDRAPTRNEAVTMLVRLLGKEAEAKAGTWETPFTDVVPWAQPYVGYAYVNGLTNGTSATTYSGDQKITATQYLTFVLRALGYSSSTDFKWDAAWELSDKLGFTNGQYGAATNFLRGDVAIISNNALSATVKDGTKTLMEVIGIQEPDAPDTDWTLPEDADLYWEFPLPNGGQTRVFSDSADLSVDNVGFGLGYVYQGEYVSLKNVSFALSDPYVLEMRDGRLFYKTAGETDLIATLPDGSSLKITLKVFPYYLPDVEYSEEYYEMFANAFTYSKQYHFSRGNPNAWGTGTGYGLIYNGNLSLREFIDVFQFGSPTWYACAEDYVAEMQEKYHVSTNKQEYVEFMFKDKTSLLTYTVYYDYQNKMSISSPEWGVHGIAELLK